MLTVRAIGADAIVVRHAEAGFPHALARYFEGAVLNAGDGAHAHPTQGLLDAMTLVEEFGDLKGRKLVICGDLSHSRVARSSARAAWLLGASVTLCGPPSLLPPSVPGWGFAHISADMDAVLPSADAVMLLRIQKERARGDDMPPYTDLARSYGLTRARAALLKPHCIIMHPGPVNRGVEIDACARARERKPYRAPSRERHVHTHGGARAQSRLAHTGARRVSGPNHDPRSNRDFVGARVVDPKLGLDAIRTIVVRRGVVAALLEGAPAATDSDSERVDCAGMVLCPGFIDPHVHLREPGDESKETWRRGLPRRRRAASPRSPRCRTPGRRSTLPNASSACAQAPQRCAVPAATPSGRSRSVGQAMRSRRCAAWLRQARSRSPMTGSDEVAQSLVQRGALRARSPATVLLALRRPELRRRAHARGRDERSARPGRNAKRRRGGHRCPRPHGGASHRTRRGTSAMSARRRRSSSWLSRGRRASVSRPRSRPTTCNARTSCSPASTPAIA